MPQKSVMQNQLKLRLCISVFSTILCVLSAAAYAGAQREEALAANVASVLQRSVADVNAPVLIFDDPRERQAWLAEMSRRLQRKVPDVWMRERLLTAIQYEAKRAGLDPQLVLGLIEVESGFRPYAISIAGARGLMQVMPFWVRSIGAPEHNLFDLTTNLRYGCTILRYYLDSEQGNLTRALARYNGSLGRTEYPDRVISIWHARWYWEFSPALAVSALDQ